MLFMSPEWLRNAQKHVALTFVMMGSGVRIPLAAPLSHSRLSKNSRKHVKKKCFGTKLRPRASRPVRWYLTNPLVYLLVGLDLPRGSIPTCR
jgi:hypothetical protein